MNDKDPEALSFEAIGARTVDEAIRQRESEATARYRFFECQLRHRLHICIGMIAGGITCLLAGIAMIVIGVTGDQVVWFESGGTKVTAGGFGAVTMLASVAWGALAYMARPQINLSTPDFDYFSCAPPQKFGSRRRHK